MNCSVIDASSEIEKIHLRRSSLAEFVRITSPVLEQENPQRKIARASAFPARTSTRQRRQRSLATRAQLAERLNIVGDNTLFSGTEKLSVLFRKPTAQRPGRNQGELSCILENLAH